MRNKELHIKIIDALGGDYSIARRLDIKPPSVHGWRTYGIPDFRLVQLANDIEHAGIACRKELFPKCWHLIWPELEEKPND